MSIGQSWTDPFSNHTHISNIDVERNIEALLGAGITPESVLMSLLHEATHHWCFLSPVGNTIAGLAMRARRQALFPRQRGGDDDHRLLLDDHRILLDLMTSRLVVELLRPYAEGIAMAAELDSLSRRSPFISGPFLAVMRSFAPPAGTDVLETVGPLNGALVRARQSEQGVGRKLSVYADRLGESVPLDFHPSMSWAGLRYLNSLFDQILEDNLSERWLKIALDHIAVSTPEVARNIYLNTALRSVSDERVAETLEYLTEGGLRALLREDRDLAEALVVAGTVTQAMPFRRFVEAILLREGFEPDVLERLAEIGDVSLPLVAIGKGPMPQTLTFV